MASGRHHDQRRSAARGGVRRAPPPRRPGLLQPRGRRRGDDPGPARRGRDLPRRRGGCRRSPPAPPNCPRARASSTTSRRSPSAPCWRRPSRSIVAVPLAVAVALFITHIAPPRLALPLGYLVDLLAAIPSIVYGLWGIFVLGPAAVPVMKWLEEKLGFIPFFEGPASVDRPDDARRRPGAGGDDPADRLRRRPRGLLADAAQAPGRRPGARRDPLGDDPDDGPAVRQVVGHQRLDARPRPGARRDDGGDDHPLGLRRRHLQPDQPGEPLDDRRQHRPRLPRVLGARDQRPDRHRASSSSRSPSSPTWSRGRSSPARTSSR